jgi:hypothetical protein
MQTLITIYHYIQMHPLYWQVPIGLLTTSGSFEYLKHKLELQGKAKVTAYLSLVSTLVVLLHAAIVGITFAGPLGLLKGLGTQTVFFLGLLTVTYNFLTHYVVTFLQDAKAKAVATQATTAAPAQINHSGTQPVGSAVDAGVVTF